MSEKIIWTTDGSAASEEALKHAILFAEKYGSEIIGIHVIALSTKLVYDHLSKYPEVELERCIEKIELDYGAKFDSIKKELSAKGIDFRGAVLKGEANEKIVEFANQEKASLVVTGIRGHGLISKILIGSTTLRVLRESKIPVLAARKSEKERVKIENILVPIDISEKSNSALSYSIKLADRIKARISVVYVLSLYLHDYEIPSRVIQNLIGSSYNELVRKVEEVKLKTGVEVEIKTKVIQGANIAVSIVDYTAAGNTDLIVINTHGRKGAKRLILGSVAEKVIHSAHCSVLALKP